MISLLLLRVQDERSVAVVRQLTVDESRSSSCLDAWAVLQQLLQPRGVQHLSEHKRQRQTQSVKDIGVTYDTQASFSSATVQLMAFSSSCPSHDGVQEAS